MHEKMVDFTKELEYSLKNIKEPRSGNIISGKVVSITPVEVFIDIDWFQEITIPVEEFNNPPLLNDEVFIYCYEDKDSEMQFSKIKADEILQKKEIYNKYDNRIPVEGKIVSISRDKKYFNIEMGLIKGICYVDDLVSEEEKQLVDYIGKTFKFIVKNYNSKYIVLSRKLYIANQNKIEKSKFFKEKKVGDIVEGVVKQIIPSNDGVEFELGGFSGFIPASEVSYSPYKPIEESVSIGEHRKAKIIRLDREKNNIILSFKQLDPNPWSSFEINKDDIITGVVRNVTDNGIVIEVQDGITGFISKKDISWFETSETEHKQIKNGSFIECKVLNFDRDGHKLQLGLKQLTTHPWDVYVENHPVGSIVKGKIARATDFGLFIELDKGIDGLLHRNEISWTKSDDKFEELSKKIGEEIEVVIDSITKNGRKISLSLKKISEDPWQFVKQSYHVGSVVEVVISDIEDKKMKASIVDNIEAIIPISEASTEQIRSLKDSFKIGDKVTAKVIKLDIKKGSVLLSIKDYLSEIQEQELNEYKNTVSSQKITFADLLNKGKNP